MPPHRQVQAELIARWAGARLSFFLMLGLLAPLATGCMPRGPFPLTAIFPPCDSPQCQDRSGGRGRLADNQQASGPQVPGGPAETEAPFPEFHPVPTRPVFTPWAAEEAPQPSGGLLTLNRAFTKPRSQYDDVYEPPVTNSSPANDALARRSAPLALLPDDRASPLPPTGDASTEPRSSDRSARGWRAAGPQL